MPLFADIGGDRYVAYVVREHGCGRAIREILEDPYLRRLSEGHRTHLLDRPELIRAVVADTGLARRR
jgi:hypothetical protein